MRWVFSVTFYSAVLEIRLEFEERYKFTLKLRFHSIQTYCANFSHGIDSVAQVREQHTDRLTHFMVEELHVADKHTVQGELFHGSGLC